MNKYKPGQFWFSKEGKCFFLVLKVGEGKKGGSKVHFLQSELSVVRLCDDFGELIFNNDFKLIW